MTEHIRVGTHGMNIRLIVLLSFLQLARHPLRIFTVLASKKKKKHKLGDKLNSSESLVLTSERQEKDFLFEWFIAFCS